KADKLPGLNGLRSIAAIIVLVGHVYQIAGFYKINGAADIFEKINSGDDMVNLFFVISGFIITYILMKEKAVNQTVSLKNFYIKRILRIYTLYFFFLYVVYILLNFTFFYSFFTIF